MKADLERYEFARRLALEAGELALSWFRKGSELKPWKKNEHEWVSAADREVESLVRRRILSEYPQDSLIGEEGGGEPSPACWLVDPIDGTTNFIKQLPFWCVSIAFLRNHRPTIGVIHDPLHGQQFHGFRGRGAWQRNERLSVSRQAGLEGADIAFNHHSTRPPRLTIGSYAALAPKGGKFRLLGSCALQMAYVASGRFDGCFESYIHVWDVAAAMLLIEEAGGWVKAPVNWKQPTAGFPVVGGCPGLRDELEAATAELFDGF